MGAAAAVIIRRQKDIVENYRGARAIAPSAARDPGELGVEQDRIFRGLVQRAVLREAGNGRYYLDEPSWDALGRTRRRMAFVMLAIVIGVLAIMLATGVVSFGVGRAQ